MDYFLYRGEPRDISWLFLNHLPRYLGVSLKILATDRISGSLYLLDHHCRRYPGLEPALFICFKRLCSFSRATLGDPFRHCAKGTQAHHRPEGILGDTVYVEKDPFMDEFINHFIGQPAKGHGDRGQCFKPGGFLLRQVSQAGFRFTICRENLAQILRIITGILIPGW